MIASVIEERYTRYADPHGYPGLLYSAKKALSSLASRRFRKGRVEPNVDWPETCYPFVAGLLVDFADSRARGGSRWRGS
jgi:hypothetical protein